MKAVTVTLFLVSAASLAFQVTLTRFFSLAQGHHFAFMAISLALLGIGTSGTYLSLRRATSWQGLFRLSSLLFTLSLPLAYLVINYLPFDAYTIAWEQQQLLWLMLYYLTLTVPFFFSGLIIGVALAAQPERAGPLYAANLLGSGLGPPLALLALATVGGPGAVFMGSLLGWLAVGVQGSGGAALRQALRQAQETPQDTALRQAQDTALRQAQDTPHDSRQGSRGAEERGSPSASSGRGPSASPSTGSGGASGGGGGWKQVGWWVGFVGVALGLVYLTFRPPALFEVRLTPYKALSQGLLYPGSEIIFSQWNAFSRVDVLQSEGIRSAPGLSFAFPGELPPQLGLLTDGDNLSPIPAASPSEFTAYLPLALAFQMRPAAEVLILEPGGGLAVLAALEAGAESVTVVQGNPTVVEVVAEQYADFTGHLYDDPRVTLVIEEPRSYLRRTVQQFDLIILPLTDSFRPVTAGAYTLGEDYRYTVEAFSDILAHLSPAGLVVVERWLQLPPSESLRLWGTLVAALRRSGKSEAGEHLLALRSLQTSLIGASRTPLSAEDLATTRRFALARQYDLVWLPDLQPEEVNRFSQVPDEVYYRSFAGLLMAPDPAAFYQDYPYAISPPTDDRPFFFHFFKWRQTPEIWQALGRSWQPFGGSGYLVLVVLLALVTLLSAVLILLPLLVVRHRPAGEGSLLSSRSDWRLAGQYLSYFGLLGLGFLFVEIPLLQRFILYLGQPAYAFAIVVATLLVTAGLGSQFLAARLPLRLVLLLITLLALAYPLLLPYLFAATLQLPFAGRVLVTILALSPLGLLLGIPFPRGFIEVGRTMPGLAPWVWAVNGCVSVISSVLAVMVALTWGFSAVVWGAALAYGLASLVMRRV